jgi:hypothetical protein
MLNFQIIADDNADTSEGYSIIETTEEESEGYFRTIEFRSPLRVPR